MGSLPSDGAMIAIDLNVAQAEKLVADVPGCDRGRQRATFSDDFRDAEAVARAHAVGSPQGGRRGA